MEQYFALLLLKKDDLKKLKQELENLDSNMKEIKDRLSQMTNQSIKEMAKLEEIDKKAEERQKIENTFYIQGIILGISLIGIFLSSWVSITFFFIVLGLFLFLNVSSLKISSIVRKYIHKKYAKKRKIKLTEIEQQRSIVKEIAIQLTNHNKKLRDLEDQKRDLIEEIHLKEQYIEKINQILIDVLGVYIDPILENNCHDNQELAMSLKRVKEELKHIE